MVAVFEEVRRVLRSDGTLWMNYGDCYASGGYEPSKRGGRPDRPELPNPPSGWATRDKTTAPNTAVSGLKPKDLVGMPWRVAFALQAAGWYLRSDIIWHKPNPMPESVTDRPTSAHEYLFLLAKSPRYFYDADAIRDPSQTGNNAVDRAARVAASGGALTGGTSNVQTRSSHRNKRSVWTVATHAYKGCHFATFPPKLITPCIMAGTSERGCCSSCGAPWVRMTAADAFPRPPVKLYGGTLGHNPTGKVPGSNTRGCPDRNRTTTGWRPSCKCTDAPKPCTVLDPFGGSGTVAEVCEALGRRWVLIELNPEYEPLIRQRTAQRGLFSQ